jgi:hypothetical protein
VVLREALPAQLVARVVLPRVPLLVQPVVRLLALPPVVQLRVVQPLAQVPPLQVQLQLVPLLLASPWV